MGGTAFGLNPKPLFEDGSGPVLEAVGGEFQPRLATVYPGGGAYLNVALYSIFELKLSLRLLFMAHSSKRTILWQAIRKG
jgi:hypothetical protein